jgi:hypothetical protein
LHTTPFFSLPARESGEPAKGKAAGGLLGLTRSITPEKLLDSSMGFLPLEPVATYDETRDEDGPVAFKGKAKAFRVGDRKDTRSRHVARRMDCARSSRRW